MAEINTKMDNNQAEMRSIVDEWMTDIKDAWKETTACHEVTEADMMKT
jgi:ABC-type proline/glycine betaine transport system substrate-binding protein